MFKRIFITIVATLVICTALTAQAATLSQTLKTKLAGASDATKVGLVIVAFKTDSTGLKAAHLDLLRGLGIKGGYTLPQLGMVATPASAGQVRALAANNAVRSIWSNDKLYYFDNQARTLVGLDKLRADTNMTRINGGLAVSGRGDFAVVINDSGIDATHEDLKYPNHVVQNVQILSDQLLACTAQTGCVQPEEFNSLMFQ